MTMSYPEITDIRNAAIRLHLIGSTWLKYLPIDVLAAAYNGTGPEFLPQRIRQKLDAVCRPFLPAVQIHDVDYTFSDGSEESFKQANRRFFFNCIICANKAYSWTKWRRYALYIQAWAMYRAVSHPKFGWTAWIQAYNKTQNRKENNE